MLREFKEKWCMYADSARPERKRVSNSKNDWKHIAIKSHKDKAYQYE